MAPLKLAVLNLSRKRLPSIVCIVAIAISVGFSGILYRLNLISENRFSDFGAGGDAIVGAKAGGIEIMLGALNGEGELPGYLPYALFESMRSEQENAYPATGRESYIKSVIPFLYFARIGNVRVVGTDEQFLNRPEPADSLKISSGRWPFAAREVIVGADVARLKKYKIGDVIDAVIWPGEDNKTVSLTIVGLLEAKKSAWDRMVFATVATAQETLAQTNLGKYSNWQNKVLNYFLVYVRPGGFHSLQEVINRKTVGQAILVSAEKEKLKELTGAGEALGLFVTILIFVLGALSVTAMLITRFESMSLQLAVLRAIGYKKRIIARSLLWEGVLLGSIACVVGAVLDTAGFPFVKSVLGTALPPEELIHTSILYSYPIWMTAILATMASVILPLRRVYKQNIHYTLRT